MLRMSRFMGYWLQVTRMPLPRVHHGDVVSTQAELLANDDFAAFDEEVVDLKDFLISHPDAAT